MSRVPAYVVVTVPGSWLVGAIKASLVKKAGRVVLSMHEASSPSGVALAMKSAISPSTQSDADPWLQLLPTICRPCDRDRRTSAAADAGVTGSISPEII